jgi:hypothetical protein
MKIDRAEQKKRDRGYEHARGPEPRRGFPLTRQNGEPHRDSKNNARMTQGEQRSAVRSEGALLAGIPPRQAVDGGQVVGIETVSQAE